MAGTKKKVVSPAAKPLQASTPRYAKPTSISTPISAAQSLKKVNGSAMPKNKNSQVGESKRAAPTSLHMSLSLGPADSLGALSMTRKSLIMERMGDKDIVKRAFKTFQNRMNGSTTDEKPSTLKHVRNLILNFFVLLCNLPSVVQGKFWYSNTISWQVSAAFEPKMSSYHTPTKGNEG